MKTVLCCGVFDLLHAGHAAHLKEARSFGGFLTVALTVDECVGKAGRPIIPWEERAQMLLALRKVNEVIPSRAAHESILKVKPDIYVKGADYVEKGLLPAEFEACAQVGAKVRFTKPHPRTTTSIIERILTCAS